jgi:hypothetical protein
MKKRCLSFFIFLCVVSGVKSQIISTVAGTNYVGYTGDGGPATAAEFHNPTGIAFDSLGNMYIADNTNNVIRMVNSSNGIITTVAGNGYDAGTGFGGYTGDGGQATDAELYIPVDVVFDRLWNMIITDSFNNVIRKVDKTGVITTIAGNNIAGYSGNGGAATAAELNQPTSAAFDMAGNMYIAEENNNVIRKVSTLGIISTAAGRFVRGYSGNGGPATDAELDGPTDVHISSAGDIVFTDDNNNVVRSVNLSGIIHTIVGTGLAGYSGNGGPATAAQLNRPVGVTYDLRGDMLIAEENNNVVREVDTTNIVSTVAGILIPGYSGDGGPATAAELNSDRRTKVDRYGNIFIADRSNQVIRKITPACALNLIVNVIANVSCYGDSNGIAYCTVIGGTSPFTYTWSNGGTSAAQSGLSAGSYTVAVYDNNGCIGTDSLTITQPGPLSVFAIRTSNVSCFGDSDGSATSSVLGGILPYTYSWSNGGTTSSQTGLIVGTYTLSVNDNNGCGGSATVLITQPNQLDVKATRINNVSCFGESNGSIISSVMGGLSPYAYLWSDANSQTTANAVGLVMGTYTVNVTDHNRCVSSASASVTQPAVLSIMADSTDDNGNCTGSAWAVVNGGTSPYTYLWTGGSTLDSITDQCAGSYCCIITDANRCLDSTCIIINLSTGTNEVKGESEKVKVYPNPNNGKFHVFCHSERSEASPDESFGRESQPVIEVYSVLGEKVLTETLRSAQGDNIINISTQPNGVYLYRVITNSGTLIGEGKTVVEK